MENWKEIEVENSFGEMVKHIIIDRGNGEFTSMPKTLWDELQAKQTEGSLK